MVRSFVDEWPKSARLRSRSAKRQRNTCSAPASPAAASPYMTGLPTNTAWAPNASALRISVPHRMPESNNTVTSWPAFVLCERMASAMAGSRLRLPAAPSYWRPPWLLTIIPSQPAVMACIASVGDWIPFATRDPAQFSRKNERSDQVREVPEKAVRSQA